MTEISFKIKPAPALRVFTPFMSNKIARYQFNLIQAGLAAAGYRLKPDRHTSDLWHIQDANRHTVAHLLYDGWGQSIGLWWKVGADLMPAHVLRIVQDAVGRSSDNRGSGR